MMRSVGLLLFGASLLACGPAPAPVCVETLPDCSGTTAPDFVTLQATVLEPSCVVMTACHSSLEHQGDLILDDPAIAHEQLSRFVTPGDARCSVVGERITTPITSRRMPPAGGLSDANRCAILTWIEAGALP